MDDGTRSVISRALEKLDSIDDKLGMLNATIAVVVEKQLDDRKDIAAIKKDIKAIEQQIVSCPARIEHSSRTKLLQRGSFWAAIVMAAIVVYQAFQKML